MDSGGKGMIGKVGLALLIAALSYLCFWPVPVAPVVWHAPTNQGYVKTFAPNDKLLAAEGLPLGGYSGPEAAVIDSKGQLYVSTHEGWILRSTNNGESFEPLINTQGRPLGMAVDSLDQLIIADAYRGLTRFSDTGGLEYLVSSVAGEPLGYVNDVAVSQDDIIYFTDSSRKFPAEVNGGTYPASLLDIMEHGGHGRVFQYDPKRGSAVEIANGLNFANGIAIAKQRSAPGVDNLLVVETGSYRLWRMDVHDKTVIDKRVIVENLPGFPDNIAASPDGNFWLGLVSPRSHFLDKLSDKVFVRRLVQRLPAALRPKAQHYGMVVKVDLTGRVIDQLQDPSGKYFTTTGVAESQDYLFISRLHGETLARLKKDQ